MDCPNSEAEYSEPESIVSDPGSASVFFAPPLSLYFDKGKQPAYSDIIRSRKKVKGCQMPKSRSQESNQTSNAYSEKSSSNKTTYKISPSTVIYLAGVPPQPLGDIKRQLSSKPISVQARHIRNASWIDGRILELLVDSNHVQSMKNRIMNYSPFHIRKSFDSLSPESFHWEGDIPQESQITFLKQKLAARLGVSIASTQHESTRNHIMQWAKNRGVESQVLKQLDKEGIVMTSGSSYTTTASCESNRAGKSPTLGKERSTVTAGAKRFSILKRPYSSLESIQELVLFHNWHILPAHLANICFPYRSTSQPGPSKKMLVLKPAHDIITIE